MRVTVVSPGVTDSELVDHLADPEARAIMRTYRAVSLPADAIAYAVAQPPEVDVNEIVVRPAASAQ